MLLTIELPLCTHSSNFKTKCRRFFSERAWSSWAGLIFIVLSTLSKPLRLTSWEALVDTRGSIGGYFSCYHLQVLLHLVVPCIASSCALNASLVFRVAQSRPSFSPCCACSLTCGIVSGHLKKGEPIHRQSEQKSQDREGRVQGSEQDPRHLMCAMGTGRRNLT